MERKIELSWVNFFKGLAVIGVFLTHCVGFLGEDMQSTVWYRILVGGRFGVWVFFMINAVLCCVSYERTVPTGVKGTISWIGKKVVRLYPMVLIVILIKLLFREDAGFLQIFSAAFLLDGFVPIYWNSFLNGFLSVLVLMWIIFPLWFMWIGNLKRAIVNVLFTYAFAKVSTWAAGCWSPLENTVQWANYVGYVLIGVESFSVGILFYHILKKESEKHIDVKEAWLLIIGGVCAIIAGIVSGEFAFYWYLFPYCAVIVGSLCIRRKESMLWRSISFLGELSLGIYLIHLLIFAELSVLFPGGKRLILWNAAISCVAAFALERLVNRPFRKLLNRIWKS